MEYRPTLSSAIDFSITNKLEEWIHLFLCGEGNNKTFSDGLKLEPRRYYAPKMISFYEFDRCCGPEKNMKYQVSEESFINRVNDIAAKFNKGNWDMPPLLVNHDKNGYELNDGNHRYEALKKLKINQYWVIIWETIK
jgi:hypothetical protein